MQNRARTEKQFKAATVCRFAIVPPLVMMHFKFHSKKRGFAIARKPHSPKSLACPELTCEISGLVVINRTSLPQREHRENEIVLSGCPMCAQQNTAEGIGWILRGLRFLL